MCKLRKIAYKCVHDTCASHHTVRVDLERVCLSACAGMCECACACTQRALSRVTKIVTEGGQHEGIVKRCVAVAQYRSNL